MCSESNDSSPVRCVTQIVQSTWEPTSCRGLGNKGYLGSLHSSQQLRASARRRYSNDLSGTVKLLCNRPVYNI